MPRNSEDAIKRLRLAALELFAQNGFDQTTAAQIAARAGVTERTFFRHFPDKREVLFDGQDMLGAALSTAITEAPAMVAAKGCAPPMPPKPPVNTHLPLSEPPKCCRPTSTKVS